MDNPHKIRLSLIDTSRSKPPVIVFDIAQQIWQVWTSYNTDMSQGTFVSLLDNGILEKTDIYPDGTIASVVLTR